MEKRVQETLRNLEKRIKKEKNNCFNGTPPPSLIFQT